MHIISHISFLPADGMALFPFILVKKKASRNDPILINHEKIHLVQQLELVIIFFYIFYIANYLFNLLRYKNHHMAYRNIVFEKEAYAMDHNPFYLKKRKLFSWLRFL